MSERVEHLVVAMLAVGGYSLQRVWNILPQLQAEGLTDSSRSENANETKVVQRLARAGYDRGPTVTTSMAKRLVALHAAARDGLLDQAARLMREGRLKDAEKALCSVKGIGPIVFKHFAILEGATK